MNQKKKKFSLGQKIKVKHGARVFYNLSSNDIKFKNNSWHISQVSEAVYKKTTRGCYTKKVFFDGEVVVSDPQIVFGENWHFCEIILDDKPCKVHANDLFDPENPDPTPAQVWNF